MLPTTSMEHKESSSQASTILHTTASSTVRGTTASITVRGATASSSPEGVSKGSVTVVLLGVIVPLFVLTLLIITGVVIAHIFRQTFKTKTGKCIAIHSVLHLH